MKHIVIEIQCKRCLHIWTARATERPSAIDPSLGELTEVEIPKSAAHCPMSCGGTELRRVDHARIS